MGLTGGFAPTLNSTHHSLFKLSHVSARLDGVKSGHAPVIRARPKAATVMDHWFWPTGRTVR
jgi:hypothetical protein